MARYIEYVLDRYRKAQATGEAGAALGVMPEFIRIPS